MNDPGDPMQAFDEHRRDFPDLPPVQPPSAGFIVQLFVVPALIVLAVVGVWLLFGMLAHSEQDWQPLLTELQHPNLHRRWRGALGLAQLLEADQRKGADGQQLAQSPDIARALVQALRSELKNSTPGEEDLKYEAFLVRTLGMVDQPELVLPACQEALQVHHDQDIRINALLGISVLAHRFAEAGRPIKQPGLIDDLILASEDPLPRVRQPAAFALGLFPEPQARERLLVLLTNSDLKTSLNAAIGLARQHDSHGLAVFEQVLKDSQTRQKSGSDVQFEQFVELRNTLMAVDRLAPMLSTEERANLAKLVRPVAEEFEEPKLRLEAKKTLHSLEDKG